MVIVVPHCEIELYIRIGMTMSSWRAKLDDLVKNSTQEIILFI